MAKKKEKPQIINNIQELNLEIDYDKLAEAIVKAEEEFQKEKKRPNKFRAIGKSIFNMTVSVVAVLLLIGVIIAVWSQPALKEVLNVFESIQITGVLAIFAILHIFSAIECWKDDDENAIATFNNNIALFALIVALIALYKGVR